MKYKVFKYKDTNKNMYRKISLLLFLFGFYFLSLVSANYNYNAQTGQLTFSDTGTYASNQILVKPEGLYLNGVYSGNTYFKNGIELDNTTTYANITLASATTGLNWTTIGIWRIDNSSAQWTQMPFNNNITFYAWKGYMVKQRDLTQSNNISVYINTTNCIGPENRIVCPISKLGKPGYSSIAFVPLNYSTLVNSTKNITIPLYPGQNQLWGYSGLEDYAIGNISVTNGSINCFYGDATCIKYLPQLQINNDSSYIPVANYTYLKTGQGFFIVNNNNDNWNITFLNIHAANLWDNFTYYQLGFYNSSGIIIKDHIDSGNTENTSIILSAHYDKEPFEVGHAFSDGTIDRSYSKGEWTWTPTCNAIDYFTGNQVCDGGDLQFIVDSIDIGHGSNTLQATQLVNSCGSTTANVFETLTGDVAL